jgi:hypothetical protein
MTSRRRPARASSQQTILFLRRQLSEAWLKQVSTSSNAVCNTTRSDLEGIGLIQSPSVHNGLLEVSGSILEKQCVALTNAMQTISPLQP